MQLPHIWLDWAYEDRAFELANYRALESLLQHYPDADIKVLIFGQWRTRHYK